MILNLKGFSQLIEDMSAAVQSAATSLIDVSVGSVVRAILEANASVVLWLQWLILQVLQTTRASTCSGPDLDSWMGDFGLSRLSATPATGVVTFSRYASSLAATIPVGAVVKTASGSVDFTVVEDDNVSIWSSALGGYVLPAGVTSCDIPIMCSSSGRIGNVLANTITMIAAALPGVDLVNNASPLVDGADAESDQSFRSRFQYYLASRARATLTAVRSAIANVRQGLDVVVKENIAADGSQAVGFFLVIVDDGSGFPASDLLASIATAVEAVRPIGTVFAVVPPHVLYINVSFSIMIPSNKVTSGLALLVQQQVATYLNSLAIERTAAATRVAECVYQLDPDIENVTTILLNGLPSDVVPAAGTVIKAGQIVVTIHAR